MPVNILPKEQWTVIQTVDGKVCLPMTVDNEAIQWCGPVGSQTTCVIGKHSDGNSVYVDCSMADYVVAQINAHGGEFVVEVPPGVSTTQSAAFTSQQDFRAESYTVAGNGVGAAYSASGVSLPLWAQISLNVVVWAVVVALVVKFAIPWLKEWKTATSAAYGTQFKRPRSLRNRIEFEEVDLQ